MAVLCKFDSKLLPPVVGPKLKPFRQRKTYRIWNLKDKIQVYGSFDRYQLYILAHICVQSTSILTHVYETVPYALSTSIFL